MGTSVSPCLRSRANRVSQKVAPCEAHARDHAAAGAAAVMAAIQGLTLAHLGAQLQVLRDTSLT
jgi:hypothetical protein